MHMAHEMPIDIHASVDIVNTMLFQKRYSSQFPGVQYMNVTFIIYKVYYIVCIRML